MDFKARVDSGHWSNWRLWSGENTWGAVLGEEQFELLTTHLSVSGGVKRDSDGNSKPPEVLRRKVTVKHNTSVTELMGLIRNKYEHNSLYTDQEKEQLGWFRKSEINCEWQFCDNLYAIYWTTRFPLLLCYLWWQFRVFRETRTVADSEIQRFYPFAVESCYDQLLLFQWQLDGALLHQLEQGAVESRYEIRNENNVWFLEFRTLQDELINSLLGGSGYVEIKVTSARIACIWFSKSGICVDQRETNLDGNHIIPNSTEFKGKLITANKLDDLNLTSIVQTICESNTAGERIVIFTSSENRQAATNMKPALELLLSNAAGESKLQFSEAPVQWNELSASTRQTLQAESKFIIGDKLVPICSILPDDESDRKEILVHLNGSVLNQLLRKVNGKLFPNLPELPPAPQIYFERRLSRYYTTWAQCSLPKHDDGISLIINTSLTFLKELFPLNQFTVANSSNFWSKVANISSSGVVLFNSDTSDLPALYDGLMEFGKKIHCVRYSHDAVTFEWIATLNRNSTREDIAAICNYAHVGKRMTEDEFLRDAPAKGHIFIADKPGMGKSLILASLATKMTKLAGNVIVIFHHMSQFFERLKCDFTKDNILETLLQLDKLSGFETNLVQYWLKGRTGTGNMSFEVFFDGLDEVSREYRATAIEALKVIDKYPGIRLWISLRDHMTNDLWLNFASMEYYQLEPFSEEIQIQFLQDYWQHKLKLSSEISRSSKDLRDFAQKCVQIPFSTVEAKITGIPLHCRMLAEMYEMQVLEGDFMWDEANTPSLTDLYGQLLERKFEIYIRDKKGIGKCLLPLSDCIFSPLRDQMELSHVYFALKLIMGEDVANVFKSRLIITERNNELVNLTVLEQGIIVKLYPLTFIHRTFSEYILARFAVKVITGQFLHITVEDPDFREMFWEDMLATFWKDGEYPEGGGKSKQYEIKYPIVCHFLSALWEQCNEDKIDRRFEHEIGGLLLWVLHDDVLVPKEFRGLASMFAVANYENLNGVVALCSMSRKHLLGLFIIALLIHRWNLAKYLIENQLASIWRKLPEYNEKRYGLFHYAILGVHRRDVRDWNNDEEMAMALKWIMERDPSVLEHKDVNGRPPLREGFKTGFWFISEKSFEFHKVLVTELGANVNATDNNGNTVLHSIFTKPEDMPEFCRPPSPEGLLQIYLNIVKFFMENGCTSNTINVRNCKGQTPLHSAVEMFGELILGALKTFKESYGADFNLRDGEGRTVLHVAVEMGLSLVFIKELVCCGADISIVNGKGQNALELARERGNHEHEGMLSKEFERMRL